MFSSNFIIFSCNCSIFIFFVPEQPQQKNLTEKKKIEQNTDTPSLDQKETLIQISREDALKESKRVQFENESIIGSISLKVRQLMI